MMKLKNLKEKQRKRLLRKSELKKNAVKRFLRPKIYTEERKYESPTEYQVFKALISTGDSYFKI